MVLLTQLNETIGFVNLKKVTQFVLPFCLPQLANLQSGESFKKKTFSFLLSLNFTNSFFSAGQIELSQQVQVNITVCIVLKQIKIKNIPMLIRTCHSHPAPITVSTLGDEVKKKNNNGSSRIF